MAGSSFWNTLFNKVKQYQPTPHGIASAKEAFGHMPFDVAGFLGDAFVKPITDSPSELRGMYDMLTGHMIAAHKERMARDNAPGPVSSALNKVHDYIHHDIATPNTPIEKYVDAGIRGGTGGLASQAAQDNISDKNPFKPALVDAAGLAGMLVPGALGRRAPKSIDLGKDIIPYEKPTVNADGTPKMGQFASQKDAAMHMRANGYSPYSHDIVAHGDDSYSVIQKAPDNINLAEDDTPQNINVHEEQASAPVEQPAPEQPPVPQEEPQAPLAPDGLPGNGKVASIDPQMIARIMGNPGGAWDGTPPVSDSPANLPTNQDNSPLRPDIAQHLMSQEPPAAINTASPYSPEELYQEPQDDLADPRAKKLLDSMGVAPHLNAQIRNVDISHLPQWLIDKGNEFSNDHLENMITRIEHGERIEYPQAVKERDNAPSQEEISATPGVNARRMAKMLGPQLYGDPTNMGAISVKEVLQNSFDAIKDAMAKHGLGEGHIAIETDHDARSITMHDNGIGMAPETLGGKFLQIAGTGKEGDNASGGFGIAKMLFLYGNKELHVTTMRDGKVSEMHTNGEQLFDSLDDLKHAPKIQIREPTAQDHKDFPHGHGTKIKMVVPSHFDDPMSGEKKEIEFPRDDYDVPSLGNSPMFAPIHVEWNGYKVRNIGKDFPKEDYNQFAHVRFGWGKADVYVSKEATGSKYHDNVHFLSNGLHQFSAGLTKTPGEPWGDKIPYNFYVDLHPKVKPEDAGYPFNFNRQGLTEQSRKEVYGILDYIQKLYAHKSLSDEAKSFGDMYYVTPETGEQSKKIDLKPDMPTVTDGFRGIQQGDNVDVRDGRMFINGKELPALTPEELKNAVPSTKELKVNPSLIDTQRIMVHDNTRVAIPGEDAPKSEQPGIVEHMRDTFGKDFDEFVHDTGIIFKELRDMVSEINPSYHGLQDQAIGLSFDPAYRGVSIRVPFEGSFLNPLVPSGSTPREYGAGLLGTMVHELAHYKVRSHNAEFPAEMQEINLKLFGNPEFGKWFEEAITDIAKYKDIIEYGRRLFNEKYVKARTDSFKDGVWDERPEGNDDGDANGVPRQRSGGPGSEPVSEGTAQEHPSITPRGSPNESGKPRGKTALFRALADVLEQGKPYRSEITARISAERSARIRAAMQAGSGKSGREALYAELKQLKGEMSRAYIQPIAQHFTPQEIDSLLDAVKSKLGTGYDGIRARVALDKLFDPEHGLLPTEGEMQLLSKALPQSVIHALMSDEAGSLNLDALHGIDKVTNLTGIPRALKTIGDFGVPFRQCIMLIGTKAYWKAMPEIFKGMATEQMFQKSWDLISTDPDYYWMQKAGVAFSSLSHTDLSKREEFAPSVLAEKFPLTRRSERGYTGYLNMVRFHTFKRLLGDARKLGVDPTANPEYLKQLGSFTNMMTGRGDLGKRGNKAAPFLASMFFSPRLNASRVQMMFHAATWWRLPKQLRKEVAKSFITYAIYMGTILGVANSIGGHFGAHVEMDPRSTEFARIQIGDTYFDPSGSFQPFVRTAWQFFSGEKKNASGEIQPLGQKYGQPTRLELVTNFIEGKASPNAAIVMDMMRGPDFAHPKDITGEVHGFKDFDKDNWNKNPLVNLVMPMGVEAGVEAGQDYGAKSPLPYASALAETFGIGAKTYKPRVPKTRSKSEFDDGFSKKGSEFGSDFGKDDFQ